MPLEANGPGGLKGKHRDDVCSTMSASPRHRAHQEHGVCLLPVRRQGVLRVGARLLAGGLHLARARPEHVQVVHLGAQQGAPPVVLHVVGDDQHLHEQGTSAC